jgi:hypothetical protein
VLTFVRCCWHLPTIPEFNFSGEIAEGRDVPSKTLNHGGRGSSDVEDEATLLLRLSTAAGTPVPLR